MKNRGGGAGVDGRLKHRVAQYLSSTNSKYVDVAAMALELQKTYRMDYGRRNKIAFRIQVEKAHDSIQKESGLDALESKHLAKRAKHSHHDTGEDSSVLEDSSDADEEDVLDASSTRHMNNSLMSLYQRRHPDSASSSPRREASSGRNSASTPSSHAPTLGGSTQRGTQVSSGGWFIDKGGGPDRPNITIDLCDEDEAKNNNHATDVSMLEPEKTPKKGQPTKGRPTKRPRKPETESGKFKLPELQQSTFKFADVGGNEEKLAELCKLLIHMRHPEIYKHLGVVPPRGFLLHGPPGCGKTLLAQAVAGEMNLPMLKVSAPELVSGVSGESEQKLRELFQLAMASSPCILFMDEIDAITPKREMATKDMERRIVAQLLTCMDDLNSLEGNVQVLVIGATNRPDSLDPALRRAGRFDREICLGIPDEGARLRILQTLCRKLRLPEDFDYRRLARLTPGYVGADLMALCREAAMTAVNRVLLDLQDRKATSAASTDPDPGPGAGRTETDPSGEVKTHGPPVIVVVEEEEEETDPQPMVEVDQSETEPTDQSEHPEESQQPDVIIPAPEPLEGMKGELWRLQKLLSSTEPLPPDQLASLSILMSDFQASLASVQPSAKREGFATVPDVTWDDVGALHDIREELTMAILAPVQSPEQFKALGLSAPAGILLAGPPGCGKTLLAKAVANESGLNFISVKGPELLNMYVGESERAVRQVFQRGSNSAPCVIFFDEIDALCPRRSSHESGASTRVVNQLLTEMDGLETRKQVFIMAATNRPDIIDPAMLRPGRLDKTLYVSLPPPSDRHAILLTITKGGTRPALETDVNLEEIARDVRCDCFTGADLSALVREASINALRVHLKSGPSGHTFSSGPVAHIRVSRQNFEDAFKKVRPSVSKKDQRMYEQLKESLTR